MIKAFLWGLAIVVIVLLAMGSFVGDGTTQSTAYSVEADTPDGVVELNQVTGFLIQLNGYL